MPPGTQAPTSAAKPSQTIGQTPQSAQKPQQPVMRPGQPGPAPGQKPGTPQVGGPRVGPPSSKLTLSKGHAKVGVNFKAQERKAEEERKAKEAAEASVPAEQRVFTALGIKQVNQPEIFAHFMEKVAPKLVLPDTSWYILEDFSNIDVTAEKVSQVLKSNPYFESLFFRVVENLAKREEMPSVEGAVVLLGMQNFRNLVIAAQLLRSVQGAHPEWDKDGKLKLSPNDVLKYALKTEEMLVSSQNEYSDTAYAAGLIFDILAAITNVVCEDKKKVLSFIDGIYNHGLRTAQIAAETAKYVPDLGFQKYVFSAALIHDIGKAGMAIVRPGYINFLEDAKKKEWARPIRQFVEKEKWQVDHILIGRLICHFYKFFRPIEKIIQYHHEPFLLRSRHKNLYPLASLVCMSTNIANNFKKTDKMDDPVLALWKGPELHDFRVDMRGVVSAIGKNVQI